jgi:putative transposase
MTIAKEIYDKNGNPYPYSQLSRALEYSRNNYYYKSRKEMPDKQLANKIENQHIEDDTLGYRKLAILLGVNGKRIRRVMKKYDIKARRKKKHYKYPGKSSKVAANLANDKLVSQVFEILFSDIFELKLADRTKVRGCFVIHKKTRQVLSLVFDYGMSAELVVSAIKRVDFKNAFTLFHSDQGKQYGADKTYQMLVQKGYVASMSRAGTPTDNGIAERFVGLFKLAVVHRYSYSTLGDFLKASEKWINFYNQRRPHESLGQVSPNHFASISGYNLVSYLSLF